MTQEQERVHNATALSICCADQACGLPESQGDSIIFNDESHNNGMDLAGMQLYRRLELAETFACTGTYK
jgi:hypothetical protein